MRRVLNVLLAVAAVSISIIKGVVAKNDFHNVILVDGLHSGVTN